MLLFGSLPFRSMTSRSLRVLLVEDNAGDATLTRIGLDEDSPGRFEILLAGTLAEARVCLLRDPLDVVLLDLGLPDSRGTATLEAILRARASLPVVVLTGHGDEAMGLEALRLGAQDFLPKQDLSGPTLARTLLHAVERKRLLAELDRRQTDFRRLVEGSADGMVAVDEQKRVRYANPSACEILGRSAAQLQGSVLGLPPEPGDGWDEVEVALPGGETRTLEVRATDVEWEAEQAHLVVLHDVTRRKRAERRVRQLNRLLRTLSEINQLIVKERDPDRLLESACRIAVEHGGFSLACSGLLDGEGLLRGASWGEGPGCPECGPGGRERRAEEDGPLSRAVASGSTFVLQDLEGAPDLGAWRSRAAAEAYGSCAAVPLVGVGEVRGAFAVYAHEAGAFRRETIELLEELASDIAFALGTIRAEERRREIETALVESERRYRQLFERSQAGVMRTTVDGRFLDVNEAALRMLGLDSPEPDRELGVETIYHDPADRRALLDALRDQGEVHNLELTLRRADGAPFVALINASLVDEGDGEAVIEGTFIDVSERRRAEVELRRAQKLEAVGKLAGGVAHDFNNLLQVGIGCVELVDLENADPGDRRTAVEELRAVFQRGASLTRQLLLFARREASRPERQDLSALVRDIARLLQRLVKENIDFRLDLAAGPLEVLADRGKLEQVVTNLVVNAVDAMPQGGELTLRTGSEGSGRVWLEVEDTGQGIPAAVRERIFDPFFTTKGPGGGTGLGLSVVHGIVDEHGGRIDVESEPGRGSLFRVVLPRLEGGRPETVSRDERPGLARGRGEWILVVEDQEPVRKLLVRLLERLGYRTTTVASGEEALQLEAGDWDLLITDVILPRMTGPELARELIGRRPGLRVILMSGYAETEHLRPAELEGGGFLPKPFDLRILASSVRAALDGPEDEFGRADGLARS